MNLILENKPKSVYEKYRTWFPGGSDGISRTNISQINSIPMFSSHSIQKIEVIF